MRFGICAPYQDAMALPSFPFDYLEESVQRFLQPEQPQAVFEASWREARRLPVAIEVTNSLIPPTMPLIATPTQQIDVPRIERYVKTAFARAEQAGIQIIVLGSGSARMCPPAFPHKEAIKQIADYLARWSEWARAYHIQLALEPLRFKETNTLNTLQEAGELLSSLAQTGVMLQVDTFHMTCNDESPNDILHWPSLIAHVHVAEKRERAAPGTYGADFRPYFSALHQIGYDQRISIECRWQDMPTEVGPAIAFLRKQWEMR